MRTQNQIHPNGKEKGNKLINIGPNSVVAKNYLWRGFLVGLFLVYCMQYTYIISKNNH